MNSELQQTFERLELQRIQVLNEVRNLPPEALHNALPGKWSILMILSHVITAERLALEYVNKKILGVQDAGDAGPWEEFKVAAFKISQRSRFLKYKAPRGISEKTVVYDDVKSIEVEWNKVREHWRTFLERLPDEHLNRKIFRHVIGGRFNVRQGLVILSEHLNHHLPQIWDRMGAR